MTPEGMVILTSLRLAKNEVKRQCLAFGRKWSELSCKEVMIWRDMYFEDNHEALIEQAVASIAQSPGLQSLLDRPRRRGAKELVAVYSKVRTVTSDNEGITQ